jgi:hypothetical protein
LATAGSDHRVILWDLGTGRRRWELSRPGAVARVAFNHSGRLLAVVGFAQRMQIVSTETGQQVQQLACPCRDMRSIAFSPDDAWIAGGGRNGRIRIWDIEHARELTTFPAHEQRIRDLTFDVSGQRLITAGEDRAIRVWSVERWVEEFSLSGAPGKVLSMAALTDERLATACSDNVIRIWDLGSRELISQLRGHQGSVVALDANDRWLVSGSFDATVRIWPLDEMERAMTALKSRRAAPLTELPADAATRPISIEPVD